MDPRVKKLAKVLLNYSLKLEKGKWVKIQGEVATLPLMTELYEQAIQLGAHPFLNVIVPEAQESFLKHATDEQMKFISPSVKLEVDKMDAYIHIWGGSNTRHLSGIDPKRQAAVQQYQRKLRDKLFKRIGDKELTWVGTLYPTHASAQDADMSLRDYEDFVYRAGHVHSGDPVKHWKKVEKEQNRLIKVLDQIDQLHILSNDTDLKMRVKGRKWINCCGTENFPDGEVFTSPLETSVEGYIRYSFPAVYAGREVEDVRLEFKKGKVVNESAGKNQAFLTSMLDMDKGARFVGEVAIGTNYEIKRFSKNILFDEKIGGTCHLAVGASIPESGGKNKSSLHWDMICDMKRNSEITADGKVIYRNGKFTI
jgi:aminopeptidase